MPRKEETIFGSVTSNKIVSPTFLIDVAGSMYRFLDDIKEHLINEITEMSYKRNECLFNIIAFCDVVKPWASSVLPCNTKNVQIAIQWIRNLQSAEIRRASLKDALLLALADKETDGIYLVTDGQSIQNSSRILKNVLQIHQACPIHCLHITGLRNDSQSLEILKNVTELTNGTFHSLNFNENGCLVKNERVVFPSDDREMTFNIKKRQVRFDRKSKQSRLGKFSGRMKSKKATLLDSDDEDLSEEVEEEKEYLSSIMKKPADTLAKSCLSSYNSNLFETSMAASLMIGLRVLAKNYIDGLYYLGRVIEVTPNENFCVEFDGCNSMRKKLLQQDTSLQDLFAHEDASRHDICLGDKVLAPFTNDGGYGPGTVVEGNDERRAPPNDEEADYIQVTFFNGETAEIKTGDSIWVSDVHFERIRTELFYPESLRKSTTEYATKMISKESQFAPKSVPTFKDTFEHFSRDQLKERVERQIEEGRDLLQKLKFDNFEHSKSLRFAEQDEIEIEGRKSYDRNRNRVKSEMVLNSLNTWSNNGLPTSFVKPKKDGWVGTGDCTDDLPNVETKKSDSAQSQLKEEGYHKHRLELLNHWEKHRNAPKYAPYPPEPQAEVKQTLNGEKHRRKEDKKVEKKREKHVRKYVRTAATKKPIGRSASKHYVQPRPYAKEYQSFDGVNFPPRVDKKFQPSDNSKSWSPDKIESQFQSEPRIDIITNQPVQQYSTNFVNGFGKRDLERHQKESMKREMNKAAREEREQLSVDIQAQKEKLAKSRQNYHRFDTIRRERRRQENIRNFKEGEEKNNHQKQEIRQAIERFFKDKEDSAQRYKYERIKAMQQKRVNRDHKNLLHDNEVVEPRETLSKNYSTRDSNRNNAFEAGLQNEIRQQELKLERLQKIHNARLNRDDTRRHRAFKSTDLNYYVKDVSQQASRANILP